MEDNINVMCRLNSGCADLICAGSPFNKNKRSDHNFGGKKEFGFDNAWTLHVERGEEHELLQAKYPDLYHVCIMGGKMHSHGVLGYLTLMATRIIECHRLLAKTGSIYLHCDHTVNFYLRLLMDAVFGQQNFRSEIIWQLSSRSDGKKFGNVDDHILFFIKTNNYTYHDLIYAAGKDRHSPRLDWSWNIARRKW